MKKAIILLLTLSILCAAGMPGYAAAEAASGPKLEAGIVQGDQVPAVLQLLSRGDMVEVTENLDETLSTVVTDQFTGVMETQLLRFLGDEPYESWTGYARYNTEVYASYELAGYPLETLVTNEKVEVLDELDDCYVIAFEMEEEEDAEAEEEATAGTAFVAKTQIGKNPVSADSGSSSKGSSGGRDGGDISIAYHYFHRLSDLTRTGSADVKADRAKLILRYFQRGEIVQIVTEEGYAPELEGYVTILVDGEYAYLPQQWVQRESNEEYTPWEGYAGYNCQLFDNCFLRGEPVQKLNGNTKLTVLWEAEGVFVVQVGATVGCVDALTVRTTPIPSGNGGGNSGSGSSGGGGSWTPPVL